MRFEVVRVTPKLAASWLARSRRNRPLSKNTVQSYAADMAAHRWALTSEAISFDEDGYLDNGQHRLTAVVLSDTPTEFTVAFDAPNQQFEVIDQGRKRSVGQVLSMEGTVNGNVVAAAARIVVRYHRYPDKVWSGAAAQVTPAEVREYAQANDFDLSHQAAVRHMRFVTPSAWVAFAHIIATQSPSVDAWPLFVEGAVDGVGLQLGDPRLALRNMGGPSSGRVKWGNGQSDVLACLMTWNHWLNGKNVQFIRAARGSLPMPKPN